ncbi:Protein N-acetyltransferase, RimJ/RimL family [Paenibacillus uliginis N3/975]|uniref:Protein N-acetyltransferase, RimJ/RimL family n=1 Tax=Paenibacillus uliginis N3/975 TaxID=1313296 RepID=A0A1X7HHV9_9BACL|nr:GNAT family N-acetyltransferase [Paenibacillus uliginis]SMF86041.1 Protein N-acetyltransferase, RimJ/RimL family [Paenibacillus uliginis N3/975]
MSLILLEFPESFETDRLLIRAPLWGDGVAVNEAVRESAEDLRRWLPFANNIPSVEESEAFVRKARLNFQERTDLVLHLFDKQTGSFVGSSGLHRIDWEARKFEIGYWIRSSCSGRGLMTEAVNGITDYAIRELEANRVEIRVDYKNTRSQHVAERTGFSLEGIHRNWKRDGSGELMDLMIYAKVRGHEY